ncbi:WRKY transcription factor SUSIBA2-like [Argentina anserina]|uniref:WRKY transcription factor SUSIBA2-like n=1 Tax=Argentina anserina TaxID=57926 RepID=UPI00217693EB|nr:WRKY transcription factor SUSIBA2-like [Potentilla anserina]
MEQANDVIVADDKTKYGDGGSVSIAERRAAKCGFNAERINTPRIRRTAVSPLTSPAPGDRSPGHLTIPPGISPTALLDSPMMLPNSQALPSPTTGTFPKFPPNDDSSMLKSATNQDFRRGSGFNLPCMLKDQGDQKYLPGYSGFENQGSNVDYEGLVLEQQPLNFEFPMDIHEELNAKNYDIDPSDDVNNLSIVVMDDNCADLQMPHTSIASDHNSLPKEIIHGEDVETHQILEGDHKGYPSLGMARNSEDGYNWRKYGQKQVKGSEYPRSYYKCTHPNCPVKKKVERSFDGQITEIIYKGAPHNHAQPQPNRRAAAPIGSAFSYDEMSEMAEGNRTSAKVDRDSVWAKIQSGEEIRSGYDGRGDGLERTSSASIVTEQSDPLSATQGKSLGVFESADTPEFSSGLASVDEDDQAAQRSISLGDDADNEESESKRRKKDSCMIETSIASRAVREPRVVVQIESEIDILDDGYRWRKYGQKVVKGNPNPRSYYKCTSAGCLVRKHVERASHDIKFVITTYEGKHNHVVPAARNSNHINSSGANGHPAAAIAQPALALSRNANIPKPETQVQDLAPHFDRKPEFPDEYLRSTYLGNFNNDFKFGTSSIYQMKFRPLQNAMPYGSYGLNGSHHNLTHHASSVVPDFPMSLPLNLPPSSSLGLAGYDFNNGKSVCSMQPYFSGQQLQENDLRFVKPKQEEKDESLYDACLPMIDQGNAALSPTSALLYQRIMGGYPS